MTSEKNGLAERSRTTPSFFNFSSVIVDGLLDDQVEQYNNNSNQNSGTRAPNYCASEQLTSSHVDAVVEGLPRATFLRNSSEQADEEEAQSDNESLVEEYFHSACFANKGNGNEINAADANAPTTSSATTTTPTSPSETCANFVSCIGGNSGQDETLITQQQWQQAQDNPHSYLEIQSTASLTSSLSSCWSSGTTETTNSAVTTPRSGYYSLWESSSVVAGGGVDQQGTSLESTASSWTVSFLTEIEVKPKELISVFECNDDSNAITVLKDEGSNSLSLNLPSMETSQSEEKVEKEPAAEGDEAEVKKEEKAEGEQAAEESPEVEQSEQEEKQGGNEEQEEGNEEGGGEGEDGGDGDGIGFEGEDDEDDDTTTLSSEAVVDDIELILMPEMCQDMPSDNLSPKLVRVTELKLNADDVFCDDDETDEDQSSRHEFRSIVEGEEEECTGAGLSQRDASAGRVSFGDDDVSSGSELVSGRRVRAAAGESSKSSSSSAGGRRRRSTSGRINSGAQTDITALEEPTPLTSGHGFRKKTSGKSAAGRLGVPGGSANGKKLNWKSELTLLPSKMKVKQSGFNSFESNDERDQYSPRVAKFTSQDTLNLSSQFLKPSTLYRTRNLSRNLNQFASSESTFMLPMSSEQQLSTCDVGESPRFRDRVSSSTSTAGGIGGAGHFKGAATSYSAYQISSMLSGSSSGAGGGVGLGTPLSSARLARHPYNPGHNQPFISGGGAGHMMMMSSRHFRSSMPDLNAVNKSYAAVAAASMADSHRRRQPSSSSKSIKHSSSSRHRHPHHHSSISSTGGGGFRLQKRSSSDEETSSLIDESERCLRSSIDLLLTDELPSPGGGIMGGGADASCFRFSAFGGSSAANVGGPGGFYSYSSRRSCSQPILNDQAYPPDMKDPSMGSPFLPRKLSDMRCSRWAKVILPNGHVAVVSVKETDEIQDSLTVHTDTGCVINLPFRKVVFAWRSSSSSSRR